MDALALYEEARASTSALAGFYNRNVRVEADSGPVLVRTPGPGTEEPMDLTLWPESAVLEAIRPYVSQAPRLIHAGTDPGFQIHEFVEGRRVDELAPDGKPLPDAVIDGVERLFGEMLGVPFSALPAVPADWPGDGDTKGFALRLLAFVGEVRGRADAELDSLYEALGVPADPCGLLAERAVRDLSERPFRLLHADIHRKNMILTDRAGVAFLDWELALWGDPVYDLADHLHKTAYTVADRHRVLAGWERAAPAVCRTGWRADLEFYLAYEAMKSAVVDTVRWGRRIALAPTARERRALAEELRAKLVVASPHWDGGPPPAVPEIEEAAALVTVER
ncbi:phosphotransferase family protein [Streptomyces vilmorinianum]|uniref:phosphotransferase family protein n=1 Tax=Streptomyces vilmorinianum TaxID=3051092 RepID=UPI0015867B0B|nr:aminoglycoside phosphotransferase family protein [Streptomyces vilmorinianum]